MSKTLGVSRTGQTALAAGGFVSGVFVSWFFPLVGLPFLSAVAGIIGGVMRSRAGAVALGAGVIAGGLVSFILILGRLFGTEFTLGLAASAILAFLITYTFTRFVVTYPRHPRK